MSKFTKYVQESYDELMHKVSWPTWPDLQQSTIIVIVGLTIFTLMILGMDSISEFLMKFIYGVSN